MTVYLDTNCVIYLVEQNPVWGPKVVNRLAALRRAGDDIATSDLTRTECLAHPFSKGDAAQVADYQTFFSGSGAQVQMLALTAGDCERAARLRAASGFRLKLPD
jgi:hypothetical protein